MPERDPRVNPQRGDFLRKGREARSVSHVSESGKVWCHRLYATHYGGQVWPTMGQFRKWAANAEVVTGGNNA